MPKCYGCNVFSILKEIHSNLFTSFSSSQSDDEAAAASVSTGRGEHGHLFKMPDELNLCGKLHVPATPDSSDLARNVAKIFESMPDPDMEVRQSKSVRVIFAFYPVYSLIQQCCQKYRYSAPSNGLISIMIMIK